MIEGQRLSQAPTPLAGIRLVETSAFVAAPLGGMTLARLGAEVICVDPISGPLDSERWPVTPSGTSLFWAGLKKGKESILLDFKQPEGRELLIALVTAPGDSGGHHRTNLPSRSWSAYERLCAIRPDLIMVQLRGHSDGTSAVDYTVQPARGFPLATGPHGTTRPVNSLLPVWDLMLGLHASLALVAAELGRRASGKGDLVQVALSDIAYATGSDLGRLAQAELGRTRAIEMATAYTVPSAQTSRHPTEGESWS